MSSAMPPCAAPPPNAWRWCAAAATSAQFVLLARTFPILRLVTAMVERLWPRWRSEQMFFLSEPARRDATRRPWIHDHRVRLPALRPRANRVRPKHVWPAVLPARVRRKIFLFWAEALDSLPLPALFFQLPFVQWFRPPWPFPLVKILKQQGETAKVGETIAQMEAGKIEPAAATNPAPPPKTEKSSASPSRATPLAKHVLAEHDLRVDEVPATGPGGRISKADVLHHVEQVQKEKTSAPTASAAKVVPPSPSPDAKSGTSAREEQIVRMSLLRRTIAKRLVEAQHTAALLTTFNEVDMSAILTLRQQYQEAFQKKYGV